MILLSSSINSELQMSWKRKATKKLLSFKHYFKC